MAAVAPVTAPVSAASVSSETANVPAAPSADGGPPRRPTLLRRLRRRMFSRRMGLVTASWIVGLLIWEWVGRRSNKYSFASASDTFIALGELARSGVLWHHTQISFRELAAAFAIGSVIGVTGGTVAGMSRTFKTVTENWVTVGMAAPFAAIFPIFLVWFGLGEESKIALGAFAAVTPIWGSTRVGIASADEQLLEMSRSFGGKRRHLVRTVVLPWALPNIIEGLRLGLTRAFLGVVVGEMLASRGGLGYLINVSGTTLQMDKLLAGVVTVTIITLCIVYMLTTVQHLLVPWWDKDDR
jgi:ABC-type nitrate/sulfonate/bicarbonate transport system permease component